MRCLVRVFVYEYCCATQTPLAESLRHEGRAMLTAVLEDLSRVEGIQLSTLLAQDSPTVPGVRAVRPEAGTETACFQQLARQADYALVIAPESDDLLAQRCEWAERAGAKLLGPSVEAVRLTGDKLRLGRHLLQARIPTPHCDELSGAWRSFPFVLKPRHGAGSQATFLVETEAALERCLEAARAEGCEDEFILQPFAPGMPVSVALLIGARAILPLLPAAQRLTSDGRFHYQGGTIPLPDALRERAVSLARRAVEAVPGLVGYVGVDLVLDDAGRDMVMEINPRLTTSYVGLRALARTNLMEMLLALVEGRPTLEPEWWPGTVEFRADGTVTRRPG
jgi:predicted ATP-grasp superfamily ATP-dependent carboligase